MTGQKKYSAGQFMLMLPEHFAFLFLFKLLQVWGYEPVTCNHADGRKVLNTTSMFLLETQLRHPTISCLGNVLLVSLHTWSHECELGQGLENHRKNQH